MRGILTRVAQGIRSYQVQRLSCTYQAEDADIRIDERNHGQENVGAASESIRRRHAESSAYGAQSCGRRHSQFCKNAR
jgi:hypothetical protein